MQLSVERVVASHVCPLRQMQIINLKTIQQFSLILNVHFKSITVVLLVMYRHQDYMNRSEQIHKIGTECITVQRVYETIKVELVKRVDFFVYSKVQSSFRICDFVVVECQRN